MGEQRKAVYEWERQCIAPRDSKDYRFNEAQWVVDYIWNIQKLSFAPLVKRLRSGTKCGACATRTKVYLPDPAPTWVILHELAHAQTMTVDGDGGEHGPDFMGIYATMLHRFVSGVTLNFLRDTIARYRIHVNWSAQPVFVQARV